jgi:hypothetical protein
MLPLYGAVLVVQLKPERFIMLIKRQSMLTGIIHEMDIPVTNDQLTKWMAGSLIQNVMPHLSPDQREFLMTGITPSEWDAEMGSV